MIILGRMVRWISMAYVHVLVHVWHGVGKVVVSAMQVTLVAGRTGGIGLNRFRMLSGTHRQDAMYMWRD